MSSFLTRIKLTPPSPLSTLLYQNPSVGSLSSNIRSSFGLWPLLRMTLFYPDQAHALLVLHPPVPNTFLCPLENIKFTVASPRSVDHSFTGTLPQKPNLLLPCIFWPFHSLCLSPGPLSKRGHLRDYCQSQHLSFTWAHPSSVFIQFLFLAGDLGRDQEQENQTNNLDLTERSCSNP